MAGECIWYPGVLICEIPDSDANAAINLIAGIDSADIVVCLLTFVGCRVRRVGADVKLGNGDINAKRCKGLHIGDLSLDRRCRADDEVGLEANAVNLDSVRLHHPVGYGSVRDPPYIDGSFRSLT